jgi:NADP-dependent 3-hydroxy acid dehydrogenase YdfG
MTQRKIALVTGASSGIGLATARRLSESGYDLLLCARRLDRVEELARTLKTEAYTFKLDVRDLAAVEKTFAALSERWQAIDLLVNNAGLSRQLVKLHEADPEAWNEMIDTNVKGLLYVTRAVLPGMLHRQDGHIINIGSIAGHEAYGGGSVYCASKFAVDAITKSLRMEVVDTPIRVSTVDPGLVETEFSLVRFYGDSDRAKKVYQGMQPLTPEDVADAVVWVASRPPHVQIAEIIIFPTAQAGSTVVHRK